MQRQLCLVWGVVPLLTKEETDTTILFNNAIEIALAGGLIKKGDLVVLTVGVPIGSSGTTNMLKVHVVGEQIFV
jgi:pyruvate kinase